jgi:hypothetical protein
MVRTWRAAAFASPVRISVLCSKVTYDMPAHALSFKGQSTT